MSSIITGLFTNQSNYGGLEKDLEAKGISSSRYIVYLDKNNLNNYAASVEVEDDVEAEKVSEVFNKNEVKKTYLFNNMTIKDATNYDDLKKTIERRAAAEIPNTPDVKIKETDSGIDSQVKF
ncbi:hypothetical protein [Soonwooa purpurea]